METVKIEGKVKVSDAEVFKHIGDLMDWYYKQAAQQGDINKLLRAQDRLSALSYNLAHIAGDFKDNYNTKYYIRKVEHSISKQKFMNLGDNGTESETNATVANKTNVQAEKDAEAASYKVDLLLKQVNKVLSAMQQRISYLKQEFGRANPQTHA